MVAVDTVIIEVWSCTRSRCDTERSVGAMLSTWAASGRKRGRLSGAIDLLQSGGLSPGLRFYESCRSPTRPASVAPPVLGPFLWAQPPMKKPQALAHCGSPGSKIERL